MALAADLGLIAPLPRRCYHLTLNQKYRYRCLVNLKAQKKLNCGPLAVRSLLKSNGDNILKYGPLVVRSVSNTNVAHETTDSANILLKRLFSKTQKLEEMLSMDTSLLEDAELSMNLETLELDLEAILSSLKKEGELQDAESIGLEKQAKFSPIRKELQQKEEEIAAALAKQKQLEELKKAESDLACQCRQINDLKLSVEEQHDEITSSQSLLSYRERELEKLRDELTMKNEETASLSFELESKEQIIHEANKVIEEQEMKIKDRQREVEEKEHDLAELLQLRKTQEDSMKSVEAGSGKRNAEWLSARNELKKLTEITTEYLNNMDESSEDLRRVKSFLAAVRSQLISSQELLDISKGKVEDETPYLPMSYSEESEAARLEIESEISNSRAAELESKEQIIHEANKVIEEQEMKIKDLRREVEKKEHDLAESLKLRKTQEDSMKSVEAGSGKRNAEWLSARNELKQLTEITTEYLNNMDESSEDLRRVKSFLAAVRSQLISSQELLDISHGKVEDETPYLPMSYSEELEAARLEIESERSKSRASDARCKELELQSSGDRHMIELLKEELASERASLKQKVERTEVLQHELECWDAQDVLQAKECELTEASLQIQHMLLLMASILPVLSEKDADLVNAKEELARVSHDTTKLQSLLNSIEVSEATSVFKQPVQLTDNLLAPAKDEKTNIVGLSELEMVKESLRQKELEVVAAEKALALKEEELGSVLRVWGEKEKDIKKMVKELMRCADGLQNILGGSVVELAVEKIHLKAAVLEAQATAAALEKVADMIYQLLELARRIFELSSAAFAPPTEIVLIGDGPQRGAERSIKSFQVVENEVSRLFALTELLVQGAGVTDTDQQQRNPC